MGVKQDGGTIDIVPAMEQEKISDELDKRVKKFLRGAEANLEGLKDKKLKGQLAVREELYGKSAHAAAKAEKWLLPSEGGYLETEGIEKTWMIKQESIAREVDILSSRSQYDIVLPDLGPYTLDFTSSGRYMAVGGRKGHLAILDMKNMSLIREIQVRETVRDVAFLHNELFFAAAQKKYPYIYNRDGTELHCLKEHGAVLRLQFLKNHFLLASVNKFGHLRYQDVTMGRMIGSYRTGLGRTDVMQVNPYNGVVALGHSGGKVSMWKPTSSAPLLQRLCHKGPISAMAFHPNGHLMATAGKEKKIMLWDLRKLQDEPIQTLPGHASTLDFSQKGLLARGCNSYVQILGDFSGSQNYENYMGHGMIKGYQIGKVLFRPYEDVLGIGHSMGWSSILIPGSGEPNFDTWVANPFETSKQRREKEVHSLLDKLPPETIMLNPTELGTVKTQRRKEKRTKEEKEAEMEAALEAVKGIEPKKKTKGRNKPSKRAKKKQEMIVSAKRPFLEQQKKEEEQATRKKQKVSEQVEQPTALQRFVRKKAAT
ncbi:U3 small nucleolar RNA-associated protein 7 [Pyrus ussuriensis x Pyrus communis]|uniref:U3 small nucleolar RNA-associated protein 7 n=1 Tax=Pyrus ussuriensis x Pyrus communis TaxID=2448454 RepID=A0A5N5EW38_9ROSA|nr:U3 small nucleolar RNA-associated protein 7 [Pyrus ussuriensis x Pyrus communis]